MCSSDLGLNTDNFRCFKILEIGTSILSKASNIEKIEAFERMLVPISRILKHRKLSVFRPIQAAIEWYQDSLFINDQTIAYLSACIGLEAIFGESDMNEMSRRVEDRYAFLLGKNSEDRKKLAEEYREILKIRGKIVHAREKKLNNYQSSSLYKVQEMLRKSIMHELSVLD